jgi:energy-coupling factor transporter ATP-binding protein EcfA2
MCAIQIKPRLSVTNSAAPPAIEVRDLVKRYAKSKTNAVDGVSFEVRRGEIFALLGPNGAGKTTTIGVLTTAVLPTSGATRIMGIDVVADAREIDDRLLAPLPIPLVAVEKVLFAAIRGVIAGSVIFPLAWWILGDRFSVRTDRIAMMAGMIVLTACVGAGIGLVMGTSIKPEQISLWFTVIFTPPLFTGCTYYPWGTLTKHPLVPSGRAVQSADLRVRRFAPHHGSGQSWRTHSEHRDRRRGVGCQRDREPDPGNPNLPRQSGQLGRRATPA